MKKKILIISIQIFVVAIAIALTATTYAWFVSQTNVATTPTTITASAAANTNIDSEEDVPRDPYSGQTGQGYDGDDENGVDAPYTAEKILTITFNPIGDNLALTARLLSMRITQANGTVTSSQGEDGTPEILNNFTWRIEIDGAEYGPDSDGFLSREEDGEILYYEVENAVQLVLTFKLIFLDEASYAHWLKGEYGDVNQFAYCDYSYMRAVFNCSFEIGMAPHVVENAGD